MATTDAQVTITGTPENPVFNFVLPSGGKGEAGIGFGRSDLKGANLNTITTPGLYQQNDPAYAIPELNYPVKHLGILRVEARLLNTEQYGPSVVQIFTPITGAAAREAQVHYERAINGSTGWQPWRTFASQRIDNTAGRAIYTWDDTANREQLIYGDTGWRTLAAEDAFMQSLGTPQMVFEASRTWVRRIGQTVFIKMTYRKTVPDMVSPPNALPQGWKPSCENSFCSVSANLTLGRIWMTASGVLTYQGTATGSGQELTVTLTYPTNDPWPTTLPGTAVGTIPNV